MAVLFQTVFALNVTQTEHMITNQIKVSEEIVLNLRNPPLKDDTEQLMYEDKLLKILWYLRL